MFPKARPKHLPRTRPEKDYVHVDPKKYSKSIEHKWPECFQSYPDSPGTKTVKCLRDVFNIKPDWDLLRYQIPVSDRDRERVSEYLATLPPRPFALLHYQGNTCTDRKNLSHFEASKICEFLRSRQLTPVILDWDSRSPPPDNKNVFNPDKKHPLWLGYGTGDASTIAALVERAAVFVGIDSGPQKVAFSTQTPVIGVWTGLHPYHYVDNAPNAVHVIPDTHRELLRGDRDQGEAFFRERYRHVTYPTGGLVDAVTGQVDGVLTGR